MYHIFLFFIFLASFPIAHLLGVGFEHNEDNARTLVIKSIELSDPDEDPGYAAKIRFLPKGGGYKGTPVSSECVRFCYGRLYVESTLLIDVPAHRRIQQWSWGPWCPQKVGFSCISFMPKEGKEITIMDDDGFLLRGILGYFFSQKKAHVLGKHEPSSLHILATQEGIAPLITYLDGYCYKTSPSIFRHRADFEKTDLMFFQEVSTEGEGYSKTVRIRPTNHAYEMSYPVLYTLLANCYWHKILAWPSSSSLFFVQDETVFVRCEGGEICNSDVKVVSPTSSADHPLKKYVLNIVPAVDQEKRNMSHTKVYFQWVQDDGSLATRRRFHEVCASHTRSRVSLLKSAYSLYTFSFFTHGHTPFFTYGPVYWHEERINNIFFVGVINHVQKALQDKACALFDYLEGLQSAVGGAHGEPKILQGKMCVVDGMDAKRVEGSRAYNG
ncbi:hypothetical protein EIL50_04795 [bacterium NHP-B]|nr:hypothetical protein EIL50_04795 [bacterium NHP-B]